MEQFGPVTLRDAMFRLQIILIEQINNVCDPVERVINPGKSAKNSKRLRLVDSSKSDHQS